MKVQAKSLLNGCRAGQLILPLRLSPFVIEDAILATPNALKSARFGRCRQGIFV